MSPWKTSEELKDDRPPQEDRPRPWRVDPDPDDPTRCYGIRDANGEIVVETDCGFYPPNRRTAEMIVTAVNRCYPP